MTKCEEEKITCKDSSQIRLPFTIEFRVLFRIVLGNEFVLSCCTRNEAQQPIIQRTLIRERLLIISGPKENDFIVGL